MHHNCLQNNSQCGSVVVPLPTDHGLPGSNPVSVITKINMIPDPQSSPVAKPLISEKWEKKGKVHFCSFLPYFNLIDRRDKQWRFATVEENLFFGF